MVKIRIDGKYYEADPDTNLLESCLALGFDIPHFCYHPALGSVGACRLCAVKKFRDKNDNRGRIVMSCMEPVAEGLLISIEDNEAKAFRKAVIESLMTNHPHDCPVCDEGGECHLQDMTIMAGHNYRRYDFMKRTYNDQELGPFISHEMNRCIQCYRCVRFYRDYAGGKDLNVFASRNHVFFGRHKDGTLENEFSGNLAEVCPTGVFTDKTLKKHFTRKWDLTNAPSVCVHCGTGCNTIISERYNSLRRVMNRFNGAVNRYFLCDRGRFGYEFVNAEERVKTVKLRFAKGEPPAEADREIFQSSFCDSLAENKKIVGIGSPRASLESNFALSALVGHENFYHGIAAKEEELTGILKDYLLRSAIRSPSLREIEESDAIIILGEDLTNSAPMIALAVRQAIRNVRDPEAQKKGIPQWNDLPLRLLTQNSRNPLHILTPVSDSLDEIADSVIRASYPEIAILGFTIASMLDERAKAPEVGSIDITSKARMIADTLKNAKKPLVITGVNCGDTQVVQASLNIAGALLSSGSEVMLTVVVPECNSMGHSLIPGKPLGEAISYSAENKIDTLIILENDLYRRAPEMEVDKLLSASGQVIVLDHLINRTSEKADILIPVATFAESQGTLVSNEGRVQRYYDAIFNSDQVKESWIWITDFISIKEKNSPFLWKKSTDILKTMADELPLFSGLTDYNARNDFNTINAKIPRQTIRYSGRTAINAGLSVSEKKPPVDNDSPLAFTMEGQGETPPGSFVPFYWTPGWNSMQALYYYLDKPGGSMKGGDDGMRLFGKTPGIMIPYFELKPRETGRIKAEMIAVPVYRIFGSEELSSHSPAVIQRITAPFVYLNQIDADNLGMGEGALVEVVSGGSRFEVNVIIEESLKSGLAGIPVNIPGMAFAELPAPCKILKL